MTEQHLHTIVRQRDRREPAKHVHWLRLDAIVLKETWVGILVAASLLFLFPVAWLWGDLWTRKTATRGSGQRASPSHQKPSTSGRERRERGEGVTTPRSCALLHMHGSPLAAAPCRAVAAVCTSLPKTEILAHRWLCIPEEPPVDLCKPLVLLHLACACPAPQTQRVVLDQQLRDEVLAFPVHKGASACISNPPNFPSNASQRVSNLAKAGTMWQHVTSRPNDEASHPNNRLQVRGKQRTRVRGSHTRPQGPWQQQMNREMSLTRLSWGNTGTAPGGS